jgi:hypothetical protein
MARERLAVAASYKTPAVFLVQFSKRLVRNRSRGKIRSM